MKTSRVLLLLQIAIGPIAAFNARADEPSAKASAQTAEGDVERALSKMNQARQDYLGTVKTSGQDSPQAEASKKRLEAARQNWRTRLTARRELRRQARGGVLLRHAQRRKALRGADKN